MISETSKHESRTSRRSVRKHFSKRRPLYHFYKSAEPIVQFSCKLVFEDKSYEELLSILESDIRGFKDFGDNKGMHSVELAFLFEGDGAAIPWNGTTVDDSIGVEMMCFGIKILLVHVWILTRLLVDIIF